MTELQMEDVDLVERAPKNDPAIDEIFSAPVREIGANWLPRPRTEQKTHQVLVESLIWLGKAVDANDLISVTATKQGKRLDKKSGNSTTDDAYKVVIDLPEEQIELRLSLTQLAGIKRVIERFRSDELPGIPFSLDGKTTEITGQPYKTAGKKNTANKSHAA